MKPDLSCDAVLREEWEASVAAAWGRGVVDGLIVACVVWALAVIARVLLS